VARASKAAVLAGDIGGTKVSLGLYENRGGGLIAVAEQTRPSRELDSLEEAVREFLRGSSVAQVEVACFGVAGAVIGGRCHTTNLPWTLEERAIERNLGLRRVKLLNDVQAAAYGVLYLGDADLVALNDAGTGRRHGNVAILSVGTGLGEGSAYHPIASEGGHGDFAPRTEQEIELLRFLRGKLAGHVSYERVIAGPGLFNVYEFLRDTGFAPEPAWLTAALAQGDPSANISAGSLEHDDPLCKEALALFCAILGAEAGNQVLRFLATGGIYLTGGVPPKLLPALRWGQFMAAFIAKGRFEELMRRTPVYVVLNRKAPLIGAAHYALQL
jgi:glucokinase